jgi:nucleotide-binding universal stress UspA family protein
MNEAAGKRRASNEPTGGDPKRFRSLLVPVDLTPSSDRVLGRLALLPIAEGARLTLFHVVPESLPPRSQRSAERDAKRALAGEARHLAKLLPKSIEIDPVVKVGAPAKEIASCASAVKAELIVIGRGGGRALRDAFLGSTAERVIRRGQLPVLAVRLPARAAYRRPALALDLDRSAAEVVDLLLRMIQPPRPRVAIIHACDAPYHGLAYPSLSEDEAEERKAVRLKASRELAKLLATSLARAKVLPKDAPLWKTHLRYGSPRIVIEKAVKKADTDLLVLGTRGYSGVAHLFLGTVAGDVLREVTCDVLIVPPRPRASETT